MLQAQERDDVTPICPHCNSPVEEIWHRLVQTTFGRRYIYFCSRCRKVLGFSHRKGFWMG